LSIFNFISKREMEFRLREERIQLREENLQREMLNMQREIELKYKFSRLEIEEEWHCKTGNAINEKWDELHKEYSDLLKIIIEKLPDLKSEVSILNNRQEDEE